MRWRIPNFITPCSAHFVTNSEPASFKVMPAVALSVSENQTQSTFAAAFRAAIFCLLAPQRTIVRSDISFVSLSRPASHQVLFRQNFTRLASGSRPDRPSHSPKVVEIRVYGKTRSSRNDGRDSTRWNYHSPYTK